MTAIPLTSRALKDIKRTIQSHYPDIQSAHITEAIAAGLGYRTNAAMRLDLDRRAADDPDYAYLDNERFVERAVELAGRPVRASDIAFTKLQPTGAINTISSGGVSINLQSSRRQRAWRNVMVATINAGIEQRLFTIRPGDNRWDAPLVSGRKSGATFSFSIGDIPALGYVSDAGYDELEVHAALWPTERGGKFVGAINADFYVGDVIASGWLERRDGAWLQVSAGSGTGWTFRSRRHRLDAVAALQVRPHGFAASGRFIM